MHRTGTLTVIATMLLLPLMGFAQGDITTFNWKFEEGNKLLEEKFYNQAADVWKELVESNPENANLNWKLGFSYFNSYNHKDKALPYLEKASERRTSEYSTANIADYDPFDPKENNAPPEVDYYLGRAFHLNYELDKADLYYQKFLEQVDGRHDLHATATRGSKQVANARVLMADPKSYPTKNLGPVINTDHPDFSPVVSVDGNALFYTSRRVRPDSTNNGVMDPLAGIPYEDIYVSYRDREGQWQTPELLNINTLGHLATINVSADGQTLFMYRDDNGDGNIYESRLVGETWSEPQLLGSDINTKAWETHAATTADGNTMYFVSNRKGGMGGRDIYRVVKLPTGEWSKAQSLGNVINTPSNEDAPFIHPNGRQLFFASQGHNSMGGFDIFYSELNDDGTWTVPENIGYPINTVDDDVFFVTTADGRQGYFSSDKEGGFGEKDIYSVELPSDMRAEGLTVLKGYIIPPAGQKIPPSTVLYVTDIETGEVSTYKPRQRDGVYVVILPPCKEYNLDYRVDGSTIHTEDVYVECETAYQEINKEIYLNPVSITGPATIVDVPDPNAKPIAEATGEPKGTEGTTTTTGTKGTTGTTGTTTTTPPATTGTVSNIKDKVANAKVEKTDIDKVMTGEGKYTAPDASYPAQYSRFYDYNQTGINNSEQAWNKFVADVIQLIDKNGKAQIVIESSASNVPTKTFGTNDKLSTQRRNDARDALIQSLTAAGKNAENVLLEAENIKVQGPAYAGDYQNTKKYGKFQYVELKAH